LAGTVAVSSSGTPVPEEDTLCWLLVMMAFRQGVTAG
jgi:hypothetical protein